MSERQLTGAELAEALNLHIKTEELLRDKRNKPTRYPKSRIRFIKSPGKLFLIRFTDEHSLIIMADSEEGACIMASPYMDEYEHHCSNPYYDKSCSECVEVFDRQAERLNSATITWLGWGQPDYNWAMYV